MNDEAHAAIREYLGALDSLMSDRIVAGGNQSPHRFMLEHGRAFAVGPKTYAGKRMTPKACYSNAGQRALGLSSKRQRGPYYAEGYVTSVSYIAIPHAFLVTDQGEVIDPTLTGDDPDYGERAYFGLAFSPAYHAAAVIRSGYYSLLDDMGPALIDIVKGRVEGMLVPGIQALPPLKSVLDGADISS
jgi:hypothetical protein